MPAAKETIGQIEYYSRAMKAPRIREAATRLADQAREGGWTHEEYLAAVLSREVAAGEASGAEIRARAAGFPARKSLEDFNIDHQPGLKRDTIAHLATGAFLTEASNIVLLGPPGTGKTHLATGLGLRATQLGHRPVRHRHRLGRTAPGSPPERQAAPGKSRIGRGRPPD
ncbi:ATP-binding protein [Pseudarthrobacter sulfonivorans]|uniref:ATP-binding protein n=1 Tax=Pseudarthrobacter sulfonivorans TaxID=121292 RepID=UPI0028655C37|nr:ATP-binding protein [Pseudarthrobacter sulfonivorans]MDR6416926.1 DNA replication protein DnaC [Pseudarthrobacter sulfonivorans]